MGDGGYSIRRTSGGGGGGGGGGSVAVDRALESRLTVDADRMARRQQHLDKPTRKHVSVTTMHIRGGGGGRGGAEESY